MKIRIFISYCHEDITPDDGRLKIFVQELQAVGLGNYEILVDYQHKDASVGANLKSFMDQIDTADAVIILVTPGYKQRVAKKGDTGVYYEFRRIHDRLLSSEENKSYGRSFLILPFIMSGSFSDSCPPELKNLLCGDLSWLTVIPNSPVPRVRRQIYPQLQQTVNEVASRIAAIAETKGKAYYQRQERLFRKFLFQDTKSRFNRPENIHYVNTAFVKTFTFNKVFNHEVSFIVGRKGAGKSTITHVLPLISEPRPSQVIQIEFDSLPFQVCFNVLLANPPQASDINKVFSPIISYQLVWDVFLHLFLGWNVLHELHSKSRLRTVLRKILPNIDRKKSNDLADNAEVTKQLFVFSFEQLVSYVNKIVKQSFSEEGFTPMMSKFNVHAFRLSVFGKKGWEEIERVLTNARKMHDTVLVTADGFDVMAGYFTTQGNNQEEALRFERDLLLSLFQIVLNKGPLKYGGGLFYEIADFCIAIPHDRFIDVRNRDRDRYQYRHQFSRIAWSGIELSALVRKRLAILRKIDDPKGGALEDRLAGVLKKGYPELPIDLNFKFGGAQYKMPLFIYVLRHTFWRPRDVLYFYSALLASSDKFAKKKQVMPTHFVRQVIRGSIHAIVEDEFLDEFKTSFSNLRTVLRSFRHGPQTLDWSEITKRLRDVRFETHLPEGEKPTLEWKIEMLYDLGVIGVILNRDTAERLSSFRHSFSFNEGQLLTEKLERNDYPEYEFALHPAFVEYLHLDTSNNSELILPFTWEDLHDNEDLHY